MACEILMEIRSQPEMGICILMVKGKAGDPVCVSEFVLNCRCSSSQRTVVWSSDEEHYDEEISMISNEMFITALANEGLE